MRRLTLILSDLYLPEEDSHGAPARGAALPAFEWLLRFAHAERLPGDWRVWLAREIGAPELESIPVAALRAQAMPQLPRPLDAWLATPVHLVARLDHVQLASRGLLGLDAAARDALRAGFAQAFGPQLELHPAERGFVLAGLPPLAARTVDPARLLGADIGGSLPQGEGAGELRRLGAEIELWLHGSAFNAARDRARAPRVSTLWLWGGGPGPAAAPAAVPSGGSPSGRASRAAGDDPWIAGLVHANRLGGAATPRGFAELRVAAGHDVVELATSGGSLESVEAAWFVPARAALAAGALDSLDLVANDRRFRITARPGWRVWRRRRGWIEALRA